MKHIIEVCCGSYYDCIQAEIGGAKRVELNSALYLGGLTPSIGSLLLTKKHTKLKVIAMVRPRGAGFCYHQEDFETMMEDTKKMLEYGADGIAFGCLDEQGNIEVEQTSQIIAIIKRNGGEAVFHRAFDCVADAKKAMEILISLGVDRVLTSGLKPKAMDGKEIIKQLQMEYGHQIEILAGSGINSDNAKELMQYTGITQVHSSCKSWRKDFTTSKHEVSYSYASGEHESDYEIVDASLVRKLVQAIK